MSITAVDLRDYPARYFAAWNGREIAALDIHFDVFGTDIFTVGEDGRATAIHAYYSPATLLTQLGLA